MAKIKRYVYCVFFDTSSLYGEPISKQIVDLINKYKDDDRVTIKVFIPDVVAKELERRLRNDIPAKHRQLLKLYKSLKILFPDIEANFPAEISDQDISDAKNKVLSDLQIEIIPTPTSKIDWEAIIDRATRYEAPFEEAHEKGFKDAVIVETAIHHFLESTRKFMHAFVGNDRKMNEYIKSKTKQYHKFNVFESVAELDSDIKLRLDENTSKIVEAINKSARKAFYDAANSKSLYFESSIEKQLNNEFINLVRSEDFRRRYPYLNYKNVSGVNNIEIARPIFIDRPNKTTFNWQTNIVGNAQVEILRQGTSIQDAASVDLEFNVSWSATFTRKGEVQPRNLKLTEVSISEYKVTGLESKTPQLGSTPYLDQLVKQLTSIGQPTMPVLPAMQIADIALEARKAYEQAFSTIIDKGSSNSSQNDEVLDKHD